MLKDKIEEVLNRFKDVTFPELLLRFPVEAPGDGVLYGDNESLIIWEGFSEACLDAIHSLVAEGKAELLALSAVDAILAHATVHKGGLSYPVAKRIQKYTRPHWMPAMLRLKRR